MVQILDRPSSGELFGQALGTGLQALAQMKLQQFQQRQQLQGIKALMPNITDEQAKSLSYLPPQALATVLKTQMTQPYEQMLASRLSGEEPGMVPQAPETQMMQALGQLTPSQQMGTEIAGALQRPSEQLTQMIPQAAPQATKALQQINQVTRPINKYAGLKAKDIATLRKLEQGEEKLRSGAFQQTQAFRKDVLEKGRAARNNLQDLERFEDLQKEGKLDTPGYLEFLKRSGFDIPALMKPGTQEFNKIAANFMRDARQYFGARISNFELENFLKTIPSLSQSPEGRKRVIANLKRVARAGVEYSNSMRDIMKRNKNIPPLDLMEQVEDDVEKKMDKISELFKSDLAKPVPKGSSKFHTTLGAVLGDVVGGVTGLLGLPGRIGKGGGGAGVAEAAEMIPPV